MTIVDSTADQSNSQQYLSGEVAGLSGILESPLNYSKQHLNQQTPGLSDFTQLRALSSYNAEGTSPIRKSAPISVYFAEARKALGDLAILRSRAERDRKHREALRWLSENRQKYPGQWIALQGSRLLATGKTAKDVYSRIGDQQPPALVTKIEAEELPFSGW